ncbi:MAG: flippase-like domain-containing protein [Acidobacteriota bacterium]|nr:flippase-like domain-containing protein [Acidobacteriota bacterium]
MLPGLRKPAWRGTGLRVAGSAVILALLFHFVPFADAWQAMRRLPPLGWLAVLLTYLGVHLAGVNKYKLMLNGAGAGLSFSQAARCYFAGLFGALLLPSVAGGDILKAGLALRLARSKAAVVLGSLLDRLIDVAVLVALATVGVALAPGTLNPADRRGFFIIVITLLVAGILAAGVVAMLPARWFSYRMRRRLVRLRRAVRSTGRRPGRVAAALGLGFFTQLGILSLTTLLAAACGLHLPYRVWLFAWPLAKITAFLPISQAGIGVREVALAALLVPFGAAGGVVVGVGLAWETIVIAAGLISGLISLLLGRLPDGESPEVETRVAER